MPFNRTGGRGLLLLLASIAVIAGVAGWLAGSRLQSTGEADSIGEPPEPSPVAVPVERRQLTSSVVVRGDVGFEESTSLSLSFGFGGDTTPIVTRAPVPTGGDVDEGDVVAEVSGRPVFVLAGSLPAYRDLRLGATGEDVRQLQEALARLGLYEGTPSGEFDAATEAAVRLLYEGAGYPPPSTDPGEAERLESALQQVDDAERRLQQARDALAAVREPLPDSVRLSLESDVRRARADLEAETEAVAAEIATLEQDVQATARALDSARAASSVAEGRLATAQAGTHPDTGQPPTADELAQLTAEATAAVAAAVAAEQAAAAAARALQSARTAGDNRISAAGDAVAIAEAALREALAGPDAGPEADEVVAAGEALTEAREAVAELEALIGAALPRTELAFVPSLPRQVEAALPLGSLVTGPLLELRSSQFTVVAGVPLADRALVEVGGEVRLDDEALGIDASGEITQVAARPDTSGRIEVRIRPLDPLPVEADGANIRVTIPVASTEGEVLVVPVAALFAGPDQSIFTEVLPGGVGPPQRVAVTVGLTAGGYAEVRPVSGGLADGDWVVVGDASPPTTEAGTDQ